MMKSWNAVQELVAAVALVAVAAVTGLGLASGVHEPAARLLAAECRGFDALVTGDAGARHCTADAADGGILK